MSEKLLNDIKASLSHRGTSSNYGGNSDGYRNPSYFEECRTVERQAAREAKIHEAAANAWRGGVPLKEIYNLLRVDDGFHAPGSVVPMWNHPDTAFRAAWDAFCLQQP